MRRLPADRLCRRTRGRQPAADVGTERIAWKLVNMAEGGHVNTVGNEALVAVYNFLDGPNWSGVLSAVLNAEDEEENTIAVLRIIAGHGFCEPPVRVEGYVRGICRPTLSGKGVPRAFPSVSKYFSGLSAILVGTNDDGRAQLVSTR